jgi:RNA polymerase sigma-70 factor (ECF subfamily)
MVLNENPADNVLRAALERNDPAAVGLLWDRYANDLLAYLQAILCSLHDAEDVLQMVFVRIVRKRHQLAKARCLDAYIYRIARNEALRLIGRRKIDMTAKNVAEPWLINSESSRQSQDLAERLQKALARLPQPQREVIVMKTYRHKTFLQISQLLGLSQNTVASRYRYGMEKLRILLENLI